MTGSDEAGTAEWSVPLSYVDMGDSLGGRHAPAGRCSVGSQVSSPGSDGRMPVTNACEADGWIDSADVLKVTV